jgi:hypothetical protein
MGHSADTVGDGELDLYKLEKFDSNSLIEIYDFCTYHGIHHFVLTTYEKWIFGLFTESGSISRSTAKHQLIMLLSTSRLQGRLCPACHEL